MHGDAIQRRTGRFQSNLQYFASHGGPFVSLTSDPRVTLSATLIAIARGFTSEAKDETLIRDVLVDGCGLRRPIRDSSRRASRGQIGRPAQPDPA